MNKKAEYSITSMTIGIILISLFIGVFITYLVKINEKYDVSYNEDDLEVFNKLSEISNITQETKDTTLGIEVESGILDLIGKFFSDGYKALKISIKSLNIFSDMTNSAVDQSDLGENAQYFKSAAILIMTIIILIGVIIAAILKWNT